MNLSEFLTERIREDEAVAGAFHSATCTHDTLLHGTECLASCQHPARIRAECEAKRRMVTYARSLMEPSEDHPADGRLWSDHDIARDFIGLLALPYADHPDYQEDWRP